MTDLRHTIEAALSRTPDWLRQNLTSKEAAERQRAEHVLAAMIEAALTARP